MKTKVLEVINSIREAKGLKQLDTLIGTETLREDLGLTSFDLAELTVKIEDEFDIDIFEDGLVSTVGEIFEKLEK
jgi:acyl carrier protein